MQNNTKVQNQIQRGKIKFFIKTLKNSGVKLLVKINEESNKINKREK